MHINDLPAGSPTEDDYLAIDNGISHRKVKFSQFDAKGNTVTFTSGDAETPTAWKSVAVLASGTLSSLLNAVSKMCSNIRYLRSFVGTTSMGTTATTVTGAVKEIMNKIGSTSMGTTATTLTGAIKEHTTALTQSNLTAKLSGLLSRGAVSAFNDAKTSGVYTYTSSATNRPPTNAGGVLVVVKNGDFIHQICFVNQSSTTAAPRIYVRRTFAEDTWQAWYQITVTATS